MTMHTPPDPDPLGFDAPAGPPPPPAPAWQPQPSPRRGRRLGVVAGAVVVLAAVAAGGGALGAVIATRNTGSPASPSLSVDSQALPAVAQGAAAAVSAKLSPSVGTIVVSNAGGTALGSGFVISNTGTTSYLITNNHVVSGATRVELIMPTDRTYTATVVGTDSFDDLAVISVTDGHLPMATFADSTKLVTGQAVIAIGSPLGNVGSVTTGVISALHRTIQAGDPASGSQETLQDVLQTDASINPGNSGGPLADSSANVVGVNVATAGGATNIGYSIPADLARYVAETLIAHRAVQHPFLGISYLDSIDAIEAGNAFDGPGVYVKAVSAGTPAAKAGFKAGDILVAVDGVNIDNGQTLGGLIQVRKVGESIACTVHRGSQTLTLNATLTERPKTP